MFKNILVPLDGSEAAECALSHAISIARPLKANIHLLQVLNPRGGFAPPPQTVSFHDPDRAEFYLAQIVDRVRDEGIPARTAISYGGLLDQIIRYAATLQADLIVAPTQGQAGMQGILLGSLAEQIARRAPCPVLLISCKLPCNYIYRKILVPLDGTAQSESVLPYANELALIQGAQLVLVHAMQPPFQRLPLYDDKVSESRIENVALLGREHKQAEYLDADYLDTIAEQIRVSGAHVENFCRAGEPDKVIEACVHLAKPDLLMMATHCRTLVGQVLFGSVSHTLLHHVNIPLMLYHIPQRTTAIEAEHMSKAFSIEN